MTTATRVKSLGARNWAGEATRSLLFIALALITQWVAMSAPGRTLWPGLFRINPLVGLASLLLTVFVNVLAHEAGHALAGLACGFRLASISVGPLQLTCRAGGWRLTLHGPSLRGQTLVLPTDERDLRRRTLWMIAGGPLATVVLAVMATLACVLLLASGRDLPTLEYLFRETAGMAAYFALTAFVPVQSREGLKSDGARLLVLARNGDSARRWFATMALRGATLGGGRPRDWDAGCMERALALQDGSREEAGAALLAYYWALDRRDVDGAAGYLARAQRAAQNMPPQLLAGLHFEEAYLQAQFRRDEPAAARLFDEALALSTAGVGRETRLRAEAALLALRGDMDRARAAVQEALGILEKARDPGTARAEAEWLGEIVQQG